MLRDEGAQAGARRRRRRGQPSPVLRRRHAAATRACRAAAGVQHGDPRRGAPAARHRDAVLRRADRRRAALASSRATPRSKALRSARDYAPLPDAAQALGPALRRLRLASGDVPGKMARSRRLRSGPDSPTRSTRSASGARALARELARSGRAQRRARAVRERAPRCVGRLARWRDGRAARSPTRPPSGRWIRWVDVTPHGWQLHASPLSIAEIFSQAGRGQRARVDIHLGDARGRRRLHALPARAGSRRRGDRLLGEPVRLRAAGAALPAARPAAAEQRRAHRSRRRCRAARVEGQRRARVPAVHDAARARARARDRSPRRSSARASTFRCWCRARARDASC